MKDKKKRISLLQGSGFQHKFPLTFQYLQPNRQKTSYISDSAGLSYFLKVCDRKKADNANKKHRNTKKKHEHICRNNPQTPLC